MQVYYLGRENKPGVKKYVDYYFVEKKTGKFLIEKKSDRSKEVFILHHNGTVNLLATKTDTEVEYKNMISTPISNPNHTTVLDYIRRNYYNMAGAVKETVKSTHTPSSIPIDGLVTYTTRMGSRIEGTMEQVMMICKQIDEVVDISKLSGFDRSRYYYSESKKELIPIRDMNTIYLMNSITKKIRDYFDNLKVDKTFTVSTFRERLEAWTDDESIQGLVTELSNRE